MEENLDESKLDRMLAKIRMTIGPKIDNWDSLINYLLGYTHLPPHERYSHGTLISFTKNSLKVNLSLLYTPDTNVPVDYNFVFSWTIVISSHELTVPSNLLSYNFRQELIIMANEQQARIKWHVPEQYNTFMPPLEKFWEIGTAPTTQTITFFNPTTSINDAGTIR